MSNIQSTRTLIIDDTPSDAEMLVEALKPYSSIEIIGTCTTGKEGLNAIRSLQPDLVFLDIELSDMTGLELIEHLDASTLSRCHFIAYTAYVDYMLESFRNHAFDFLLKPINTDDLDEIIRRWFSAAFPQQPKNDGKVYKAEENLLMFINTTDFRLVRLRDIGIFQYNSDLRIWEAVIASAIKPVRLKRTVTNKMLLSLGTQFVQVNQKYIVNINYLFQVTHNLCMFYPPFQEISYVKVGASFRRQLLDRFLCI